MVDNEGVGEVETLSCTGKKDPSETLPPKEPSETLSKGEGRNLVGVDE